MHLGYFFKIHICKGTLSSKNLKKWSSPKPIIMIWQDEMTFELETWSHSWYMAKIIIIWKGKVWNWDMFLESTQLTTTSERTFQNKIPYSLDLLGHGYLEWSFSYFRYDVHFPFIKVSIVITYNNSCGVSLGDSQWRCVISVP